MDDFGNSIVGFHRAGIYGFAAYVMCAESNVAPHTSEQLLAQFGVIA